MGIELCGFDDAIKANKEPDQSIIDRLRFDDSLEIPWQITDLDLWANYVDNDLYELDKKVREFFSKNRYQRERKGQQKTAVPLVFAWIFGRPPTPADSQVCVKLHTLLRYYCTRYTGVNEIKGVRFTHVYYFSKYATKNKRPYSLRLRLETCNVNNAFTPYGSGRDKGPGARNARSADRTDGELSDGGSSDEVGGSSSEA